MRKSNYSYTGWNIIYIWCTSIILLSLFKGVPYSVYMCVFVLVNLLSRQVMPIKTLNLNLNTPLPIMEARHAWLIKDPVIVHFYSWTSVTIHSKPCVIMQIRRYSKSCIILITDICQSKYLIEMCRLTYWGQVTHICVSNQIIIGSDNCFVA